MFATYMASFGSASATTLPTAAQDPAAASVTSVTRGGSFKSSSGSVAPLFAVLYVIAILAVLSCVFSHYIVEKPTVTSIPWYHRLHPLQWWGCTSSCSPCNASARSICLGRGVHDAKQQQLPLQLPSPPSSAPPAVGS